MSVNFNNQCTSPSWNAVMHAPPPLEGRQDSRAGDDIYVRSVNGRGSSWFRGAKKTHLAQISAEDVEKDVGLIEIDERGDEIDAAYHAKYGRRYPTIVPSIVAPQARAATLKLVPQ